MGTLTPTRRYSKLQPKKDETRTRRDHKGDLSRVAVSGKVFRFDKAHQQWTVENKKGKAKRTIKTTQEKLICKATRSELIFRALLRHLGIKHTFQYHIKTTGGNRYADFAIPSLKLLIEIDGGYHDTTQQKLKDVEREKEIMEATNYEILRFTNDQVLGDPDLLFNSLVRRLQTNFEQIKKHWQEGT